MLGRHNSSATRFWGYNKNMLAYLFVLIAVAVRFLPHAWTFTPVGASLLYFGARMPRKHWWFPLVLLISSDVLLTRLTYGYSVGADHFASWIWYVAALWIGNLLCRESKPLRVAAASLVSATSFFLVSNFGVWAAWNMYPKTVGGLIACYVAAVPFARNFISDPLFAAVFFGIGALVSLGAQKRRAFAAD